MVDARNLDDMDVDELLAHMMKDDPPDHTTTHEHLMDAPIPQHQASQPPPGRWWFCERPTCLACVPDTEMDCPTCVTREASADSAIGVMERGSGTRQSAVIARSHLDHVVEIHVLIPQVVVFDADNREIERYGYDPDIAVRILRDFREAFDLRGKIRGVVTAVQEGSVSLKPLPANPLMADLVLTTVPRFNPIVFDAHPQLLVLAGADDVVQEAAGEPSAAPPVRPASDTIRHKRPRGRAKAGMVWDEIEGRYVPNLSFIVKFSGNPSLFSENFSSAASLKALQKAVAARANVSVEDFYLTLDQDFLAMSDDDFARLKMTGGTTLLRMWPNFTDDSQMLAKKLLLRQQGRARFLPDPQDGSTAAASATMGDTAGATMGDTAGATMGEASEAGSSQPPEPELSVTAEAVSEDPSGYDLSDVERRLHGSKQTARVGGDDDIDFTQLSRHPAHAKEVGIPEDVWFPLHYLENPSSLESRRSLRMYTNQYAVQVTIAGASQGNRDVHDLRFLEQNPRRIGDALQAEEDSDVQQKAKRPAFVGSDYESDEDEVMPVVAASKAERDAARSMRAQSRMSAQSTSAGAAGAGGAPSAASVRNEDAESDDDDEAYEDDESGSSDEEVDPRPQKRMAPARTGSASDAASSSAGSGASSAPSGLGTIRISLRDDQKELSRTERTKKEQAVHYNRLPWRENRMPKGTLGFDGRDMIIEDVKDGNPTLYRFLSVDVDYHALRKRKGVSGDAGSEHFVDDDELLMRTFDNGLQQPVYHYVNHTAGVPHNAWRPYAVQIPDGRSKQLTVARVADPELGALLYAAAHLDDRLKYQASMHSWIKYMLTGDDAMRRARAGEWIEEIRSEYADPEDMKITPPTHRARRGGTSRAGSSSVSNFDFTDPLATDDAAAFGLPELRPMGAPSNETEAERDQRIRDLQGLMDMSAFD